VVPLIQGTILLIYYLKDNVKKVPKTTAIAV
jgi:hypothetical protein